MSTTEDRLVDLDPGEMGIDLVHAVDGTPVVFLRGEIDTSTVDRLEACFDDIVSRGGVRIVSIDFDGVTFMDSSGINALFELRNRLGPGARVHLRDCSAAIRRVCDITGLTACEEFIIS